MDSLLELGLTGANRGRGNIACRTVKELQGQLDAAFRSKCSPHRAEHISLACEFQYSSIFMLGANEDSSQDPVLQLQNNGAPRRATAAEAIEKQPSDDPVLQRAIAKHITSRITAVDGTSWVAREVGRAFQGWTFTYICKESMQTWTRATAKTPGKLAIGEWSGPGGLDSINAVRPAFDCCGTLSIVFSQASRAIIVKYEHLPFHKTVSQLIDELAPETIPPVSAKAVAASVNKTLKAKRNPPADGVESSRKKKKRPAPEGEDGAEPTPKKKKKSRKSKVNPVEPPPDGTSSAAAVASTQAADPGPAIASAISPPAPNFTSLNVPPAEAERRREAAVRLLSGRGIDPTTLSTEQLSIFANQAPSLQETSLEMFAMYGAERLRIVHPNDAVGDASASPAPPAAAAAPGAANNIDPSLAVPQAVADGATRTKISIGAGAVVNVEENGTAGTTESTLKPAGIRTTRGACTTCKRRKVKCTKERPECRNCVLEQGEQCLYAPAKPRRKSEKTPAEAVSDQDEPEMAIEQNGVNGHSRVANPPTQSFSSINSAVEVQQQADRLAFSQQQQQQQQQPPHAPVQYTTALDAVQKALGQSSQANTPTTKTLKSRRRQAPETSIPVTQTLVPPPKIADHRRSLPVGPGTRQVTNQIPNIHAVPPTKTSMVQNSPTMTASPTTHAQQIQRPRYKRPGSTSVDANPSMPQSQPAYSLPPAAASIGVAQYQTSPSTTAVQPVRTRTPAAMTRRASPQTAYAAASQTGAVQSYSHTTTASDPTQDNYQRYNNASPDAYTSSWKPQNASSVAHDTAAYGTQQKTAKQAPPTGLTLPQYTASQTDSHSKRGGSNGAAPATQANGSRGRNASQTTNSQRTSHQPQTSQATAYNYNLPASQSASSYAVDNNMIPDSDSTASSAYGSSQATYGNYGNQQNTSDNHTQQNWYGSLPNGNHNRDSTYGSTATSNNALPTYQANTQRSGNVSGYSGHIYNQTSNQNIYDLFQSDRQH